ncbi:MAG: TonB-dependent receptor [Acidobacteria bacterium]|nr:TonB-dependent receptor [Acidobacteriota bacterium]
MQTSQFETSAFAENDFKLTQRLTAMFGVRYDHQTNLSGHNNAAPRLGFAYAVGGSVIRGGVGVYYDRLYDFLVENQRRYDGNVNANYSFTSSYAGTDGYFSTPANNYDLRADWGRSWEPTRQINSTVNAKLFLGVFLTGTMSANSGNVYNITTGRDDNNDTNFNDRPTGVRAWAADTRA